MQVMLRWDWTAVSSINNFFPPRTQTALDKRIHIQLQFVFLRLVCWLDRKVGNAIERMWCRWQPRLRASSAGCCGFTLIMLHATVCGLSGLNSLPFFLLWNLIFQAIWHGCSLESSWMHPDNKTSAQSVRQMTLSVTGTRTVITWIFHTHATHSSCLEGTCRTPCFHHFSRGFLPCLQPERW